MMGGGGGGGESNLDYYCDDVESDDRIEAVPTTFTNPRIKQSNSVAQTTSSPPSPKPSTVPISTPCLPQAAFISSSKHTSIITEQPSYFNHRENESIKKSESYQSNINMNQISPISSPPPPHATTAPEHIPLQHEPQKRVKQEYYTEDYTSMVMIDSNDCDSKKHIQRRESDIQESGKRLQSKMMLYNKVAMTETSTKHNYRYTLFSNEIFKNRPIGVALVFPFFTCCVLLKFRRLEMTHHFESSSLGPRGLTIEQQNEIAAIQSQAASHSLRSTTHRFSIGKGETALYVGELSPNVNDDILKQHFTNAKSVHVCRDHVSGKSLGYAYVNFTRPEDCLNALDKMNYSLINGRPCRLMLSERDSSRRMTGSGNIFVKNLPPSVDDKSLHDTFSQWGNVLSCRVIKNPGAVRCYGYVNYDSIGAAERAIELVNGTILFGKEIQVGHQIPKAEREPVEDTSKQRFTNLYVKNIATDVTEDELRDLFGAFGRVSSLLIQRDEYNNSKGFGFVNFELPEDAERAVDQLHDSEYFGKKLFVSRAQKKSEREDELRRQHLHEIRTEKPVKYQGVNLYVKNLADDVDDELLKREFAKYGQITSAKVMRDEHGISKGFGFVCFTSPEEATEAVNKMNGHKISTKEIYVALAQRKEDRRTLLETQQVHQRSPSPQRHTQQPQQTLQPVEKVNAIPNQLTLSTLEAYSEETQRQMLGERIYSFLSDIYPQESGKLTGMLLELDKAHLVQLVNNPKELEEASKEAMVALQEHSSTS
ncbi:unnamed protein product [Mucor hiemalis]